MKTLKSIVTVVVLGYNALACGPDQVYNYNYGAGGNGSGYSGTMTDDEQACEEVLRACNEETGAKTSLGFCRSEDAQIPGCMECVLNAPCSKDYEVSLGSPVYYCLNTGDCPH